MKIITQLIQKIKPARRRDSRQEPPLRSILWTLPGGYTRILVMA